MRKNSSSSRKFKLYKKACLCFQCYFKYDTNSFNNNTFIFYFIYFIYSSLLKYIPTNFPTFYPPSPFPNLPPSTPPALQKWVGFSCISTKYGISSCNKAKHLRTY